MRSGAVPSSFEMRIRTREPLMLVCTIRRSVWSLNVITLPASGGPAGAVPQVPTHDSVFQSSDWAIANDGGSDIPASAARLAASKARRQRRGAFGKDNFMVDSSIVGFASARSRLADSTAATIYPSRMSSASLCERELLSYIDETARTSFALELK